MQENAPHDLIIIGAGLSGLCAAYRLSDLNLKVQVLESRERAGGRIYTLGQKQNSPIEMGATWLGSNHPKLLQLMQDLQLETFEQVIGSRAIYEAISTSPPYLATLPENPNPSFRVKGGTGKIISSLVEKVGEANISLGQKVLAISIQDENVVVKTATQELTAKKVISTLPPKLLFGSVSFEPTLPDNVRFLAEETHTWMGDSIKVVVTFPEPFWRRENSSGTIFSNVGPIPEMYDHSNYEDNFFCLMGFFNGAYHSVEKKDRKDMVLKQLRKYFGPPVDSYLGYHETVWRNEVSTFHPYANHVLPHQNNGHPLFQETYYDNKLMISGSETSNVHPGYMEGAVMSAERAAAWIRFNHA